MLKKLVILRRRRRGQPKAADGRGSSGDGGIMDTWVPEAGQTPSWNVDQQAVVAEEICPEQWLGNIRDPEMLSKVVPGTERNRKRPPGIGPFIWIYSLFPVSYTHLTLPTTPYV